MLDFSYRAVGVVTTARSVRVSTTPPIQSTIVLMGVAIQLLVHVSALLDSVVVPASVKSPRAATTLVRDHALPPM